MQSNPKARTLVLALAAAALLALLAFLFVRSSAIDFRRDAEATTMLRELSSLDGRLDAEVQRLATDLSPAPLAIPDRTPQIARIFRELEQRDLAVEVRNRIPSLRTGMQEKIAALEAFKSAHAKSIESLGTLDASAAAFATDANLSRVKNPRSAERAAALPVLGESLRAELRGVRLEAVAESAQALEPRLSTLREAAGAADPGLVEAGERLESAARAFLAVRAAEAVAWNKYAFLTVGPRIELTTQSLTNAIEAALQDQERWRIYLFFYAGALLIGVGYLATRVIATQAALLAANESLEHRVAERTAELSTALHRLKESEAQLVQTEKMSSLGQMVAGVAHEINTPLAYVKNSVVNARDRVPELRDVIANAERLMAILDSDSPEATDLQETFHALGKRLAQMRSDNVMEDLETLTRDGLHGIEQIAELVANLKNFSRLDRSRVASFNVNEGVRATLLIAKTQLRNVDIERELSDDIPSITCSPSQVNQVLLNIVTNAAQAIDKPRGRIRVSTRAEGQDAVAIEITDNGKGIPADVLPRIFDPFFTTKEIGKGTGLGLSIAYKIAAQHGGRIDVSSEAGTGTTFTVILPVNPPPELAESQEGQPGQA